MFDLPVRRHEDVILFPAPENVSGDGHQDSRHGEGRAVAVMILHPRHDEEREERAEVDGDIKGAEGFLHQVRLVGAELFAHERGDARLDAAGAERDQRQADEEADELSVFAKKIAARERAVAGAVEQGHPENRFVTPDDFVREPRAEQRRKIIHEDERLDDRRGVVIAFAETAGGELAADVAGEDAGHAVVTEAFTRLVADDVFDLARPAAGLGFGVQGQSFPPAYASRRAV